MSYKKCLVLLFATAISVTSVLAMPTARDIEQWTPPRLHTDKNMQTISERIYSEDISVVINADPANKRDYGKNFPAVTPIHEACLLEVNKRYMKAGKRPLVLDLGAGDGSMTWKMIVAGGFVYAIEGQMPTANKMQENVQKARPFLAFGETMRTVYLGYVKDVLNFNIEPYQKEYDVTWSGNLIHLMTPNQIRGYLANLYRITASGGYAFATANAPSSIPELCGFYEERLRQGVDFPGHVLVNKKIFRHIQGYRTLVDGEKEDCKVEQQLGVDIRGPFVESPVDLIPNIEMDGYHDNPLEQPFWTLHESLQPEPPFMISDIIKRKAHSAMHFFDTTVFRRIFEEAGFVVEDIFYINSLLRRREDNLSIMDLGNGQYNVGIKAKKPDAKV